MVSFLYLGALELGPSSGGRGRLAMCIFVAWLHSLL